MSQRLVIGLVDGDAAWGELLRQTGVWFERVNWNQIAADQYSVVVVNRSLSRFEREALDSYLRDGGAVLDNAGYVDTGNRAIHTRLIGSIVGGDPPFDGVGILDGHHTVRVLAQAQHLDRTVTLSDHGGGWLAHVPYDVAGVMQTHAASRRRFYSPTGHHPDEDVARIPKSGYHDVVDGALRWLHARRGLPFVHLWRFPYDHQSLFAFRIDSDYGTRASMVRLRELADRYSLPLTIFLHVSAHIDDMDMFAEFDRHELATHGYRHKTYRTYEANWGNIAESLQVMRAAGMRPEGFAAPTGQWNPELDRALRDHALSYSSEFTLDYDGLPFHPWAGGALSSVLQMPVHPISVGALARAGANAAQTAAYFDSVITRQMGRRMPAFLYHHPMQEAWDVIESIFDRIRGAGLHSTTIGDFARWWRRRHRVRFTASLDGERLATVSNDQSNDIRLRVVDESGREAYIETSGAHSLIDLAMNEPDFHPAPLPSDLLSIRRSTLTMFRHTIEDAVSRFRQ